MQFGSPIVSAVVTYTGSDTLFDNQSTAPVIPNGGSMDVQFQVPLRFRTLSLSNLMLSSGWNVKLLGNSTNTIVSNEDFTSPWAWKQYNVQVNPEQEQGFSGAAPNGYGTYVLRVTNNSGTANQFFCKIIGNVNTMGVVNAGVDVPLRVVTGKSLQRPAQNFASGNIGPGVPLTVLAGPYPTRGILIHSASAVAYAGAAGSIQGMNLRASSGAYLWRVLAANNTTVGNITPPFGWWVPVNTSVRIEDSTVVIAGGNYVVVDIAFTAMTQAQFESYYIAQD